MTALCLGYKKNRLNLITETSKLLNLTPSRVIHHSRDRMDPGAPRKTIIDYLRKLSGIRDRVAAAIDLEQLWQSIDPKGSWIDVSGLPCPESDFAEEINRDDRIAGILRAIHSQRSFFRYSDNRLYINTSDEVVSIMKRLQEQEKENAIIDRLAKWLDGRIQKRPETNSKPDGYDRLVTALKMEVAQIPDSPDRSFLNAITKQIRSDQALTNFDILVLLGEYSPDENLDIIRTRYPITFSDQALDELAILQQRNPDISSRRIDLTDLPCFTVDGPQTLDFDDAISCVNLPDHRTQIGIHIADISFWIPPGSFLDEEARERGQTLYLPQKTWHIFPERFAESIATLRSGSVKPAMSILVTFRDGDLNSLRTPASGVLRTDVMQAIESVSIHPSVIRIEHQMTYDQVDLEISCEPYATLLRLATGLRESRLNGGAIIMPRPEISIDARNPDRIVIHRRNRQSDSQLIISELMILANRQVARIAASSGLPFPFRHQQNPDEPVPRSDDVFNPHIAYCQRRLMPRAEQSTIAGRHFTLGLDSYTNITSPIRRYFDVLAQRQFRAILGLDEPYTGQELSTLMDELELSVARATAIAYRQNRYWLLKYLTGLQGQAIKATVLDRFSSGYQIWLDNICIDAELPLSFGRKLFPEQEISVILERVSARDDILKLRLDD